MYDTLLLDEMQIIRWNA